MAVASMHSISQQTALAFCFRFFDIDFSQTASIFSLSNYSMSTLSQGGQAVSGTPTGNAVTDETDEVEYVTDEDDDTPDATGVQGVTGVQGKVFISAPVRDMPMRSPQTELVTNKNTFDVTGVWTPT